MRHKDKTKGYQEKLRTYQTENRTAQNVSITCYFLIKKKDQLDCNSFSCDIF